VPVRGSELCAAHHQDYQERRRAGSRRGGRVRGAGELAEIKRDIRRVIAAVDSGDTERGVGSVLGQLYNVLLRAVEVERRVREVDELEERIAAMERRLHRATG
jgi:ubiquinone biosynthesis protein UbiJ